MEILSHYKDGIWFDICLVILNIYYPLGNVLCYIIYALTEVFTHTAVPICVYF